MCGIRSGEPSRPPIDTPCGIARGKVGAPTRRANQSIGVDDELVFDAAHARDAAREATDDRALARGVDLAP